MAFSLWRTPFYELITVNTPRTQSNYTMIHCQTKRPISMYIGLGAMVAKFVVINWYIKYKN